MIKRRGFLGAVAAMFGGAVAAKAVPALTRDAPDGTVVDAETLNASQAEMRKAIEDAWARNPIIVLHSSDGGVTWTRGKL